MHLRSAAVEAMHSLRRSRYVTPPGSGNFFRRRHSKSPTGTAQRKKMDPNSPTTSNKDIIQFTDAVMPLIIKNGVADTNAPALVLEFSSQKAGEAARPAFPARLNVAQLTLSLFRNSSL